MYIRPFTYRAIVQHHRMHPSSTQKRRDSSIIGTEQPSAGLASVYSVNLYTACGRVGEPFLS